MIGILPGSTPRQANTHIGVRLPTGLSKARSMVTVKAPWVLVAIGDACGMLSEVTYGLHFDKPVIGPEGAPDVACVRHVGGMDDAKEATLMALIGTAQRTDALRRDV